MLEFSFDRFASNHEVSVRHVNQDQNFSLCDKIVH